MENKIILDEVIDDFNNKIDKAIADLFEESERMYAGPSSKDYVYVLTNQMEIARRVFNHFAATGEVKIPD